MHACYNLSKVLNCHIKLTSWCPLTVFANCLNIMCLTVFIGDLSHKMNYLKQALLFLIRYATIQVHFVSVRSLTVSLILVIIPATLCTSGFFVSLVSLYWSGYYLVVKLNYTPVCVLMVHYHRLCKSAYIFSQQLWCGQDVMLKQD